MNSRPTQRVTPVARASAAKKEQARIRRKYRVNVNVPRKLHPTEEPYIKDMVVVLKLASYSRFQMAKIIGISKGQVAKYLEDPEVIEKLVLLREQLPSAALELLHGYMIEAVQTIAEIMRHSQDDKMILQAAAEILDRGGMPKASRQERLNENTENVTITDDGLLDRLRDASPEVQEKAAQLVEDMEKMLLEAATEEPVDEESS